MYLYLYLYLGPTNGTITHIIVHFRGSFFKTKQQERKSRSNKGCPLTAD